MRSIGGKRTPFGGNRGITIIEVLVSLAILAIVAAAIFALFTGIVRLNRDASTEVDFSRVVRSSLERIRLDWSLPNLWVNETVAGVSVDAFVSGGSDNACRATVLADAAGADVKVVRVTCSGDSIAPQVYEMEFGRP